MAHPNSKLSLKERFDLYWEVDSIERLNKLGHPAHGSECHRWIGCSNSEGYGSLWVSEEGRMRRASHVALYLRDDVWPDLNLEVGHHCDRPWCVNPDHFFVDTHKRNMEDMSEKGRNKIGIERNRQKRVS